MPPFLEEPQVCLADLVRSHRARSLGATPLILTRCGPGSRDAKLLRRGAGGGAALVLAPAPFGCSSSEKPSEPRIAIVGAGLAGLSGGATELTGINEGFNGRAWTDHWLADPLARGLLQLALDVLAWSASWSRRGAPS